MVPTIKSKITTAENTALLGYNNFDASANQIVIIQVAMATIVSLADCDVMELCKLMGGVKRLACEDMRLGWDDYTQNDHVMGKPPICDGPARPACLVGVGKTTNL